MATKSNTKAKIKKFPTLKIEKPKYTGTISYNDLNRWINEIMGWPPGTYNCVADQEWGNDSEHVIDVSDKRLHGYDQEIVDELIATGGTGRSFTLRYLLRHLCVLGAIPPGTYVISVCW